MRRYPLRTLVLGSLELVTGIGDGTDASFPQQQDPWLSLEHLYLDSSIVSSVSVYVGWLGPD